MTAIRNTRAAYLRCASDNMTVEECANYLGVMPRAVRKAASKLGLPIVRGRLTLPGAAPAANGKPKPVARLSCSPTAIARWLEANP